MPAPEQLIEKIKEAAEKLVTLEVVTAVGNIQIKIPKNSSGSDIRIDIPEDTSARALFSQVDLLQGDIKTLFHEDLMTKEFEALRAFHTMREAQAHEIIRQNLALLERLLEYIEKIEKSES